METINISRMRGKNYGEFKKRNQFKEKSTSAGVYLHDIQK